jgi:hypothetical protein
VHFESADPDPPQSLEHGRDDGRVPLQLLGRSPHPPRRSRAKRLELLDRELRVRVRRGAGDDRAHHGVEVGRQGREAPRDLERSRETVGHHSSFVARQVEPSPESSVERASGRDLALLQESEFYAKHGEETWSRRI